MKVLIIDDSKTAAFAAKIGLEGHGFEVEMATHLTEIVEKTTRSKEFDAVLLDVNMPVVSGEVLHDKLVSWGWDSGIIFFSGSSEDQLKILSQLKGGCYLAKTDDFVAVAERIRYCVGECPGNNCKWIPSKN